MRLRPKGVFRRGLPSDQKISGSGLFFRCLFSLNWIEKRYGKNPRGMELDYVSKSIIDIHFQYTRRLCEARYLWIFSVINAKWQGDRNRVSEVSRTIFENTANK